LLLLNESLCKMKKYEHILKNPFFRKRYN